MNSEEKKIKKLKFDDVEYNLEELPEKAKNLLNWTPKYTKKNGFDKGLKKTIEWFSKKENLKRYKIDIFND